MANLTAVAQPATAAVPTLEVRWIVPGHQPGGMSEWFGRFPTRTEAREDLYLVHPHMARLSVKIRGLACLDIKASLRERGILDLPLWVIGPVTSWKKWSFSLDTVSPPFDGSTDWTRVRKVRRVTQLSSTGQPTALDPPADERSEGCSVELSDITIDAQRWWSLALEVPGSSRRAWETLNAAAAAVFAAPIPGDPVLLPEVAMAYPEWIQALTEPRDGRV